jgi:signal transduction histidine kinase
MPLTDHPGWIALNQGTPTHGVIMGLQMKNKLKWVKKSAIPLFISEETLPHALVTIDDITDLKEKEAKLHEANATKDRFFSLISHDLRSPLNAIFGLTEILEEEVQERGEVELAHMIGMLKEASGQAIDLLVNLLEWSRAQSGRIAFEPAPCQLLPLVQEARNLLAGNLQEKQLTFTAQVAETLWIEADKNMLRTILRNLLSNAVKFTPVGGTIDLKTWEEPGAIFCSITDNGVGIKAKDLDKLFRLDQAFSYPGTQAEKGTGLGLILCKDFVERHGGTLTAASIFGQGSTFTFSLPVAQF